MAMLTVLFGSETGTAQDVAEWVWRGARRRGLRARVAAMDDVDVALLPRTSPLVLVCATAGQGDAPANMTAFWRFLRRRALAADSLRAVRFGVLGLGDSTYARFNFAAKKLHRRLLQLGAQPLCDVGLADDQHPLGADTVAQPWISELWPKLVSLVDASAELRFLADDARLPARYSIVYVDGIRQELSEDAPTATLSGNERVTAADHFQDTRLITFKLHDEQLGRYLPGDVAVIRPSNLLESVDLFLSAVEWHDGDLDRQFFLSPTDSDIQLPTAESLPQPTTLRHCINHYWDLQCVPRRSFFELLATFAEEELEREKLHELSAAENQEDLYDYCNRPRRTVAEALRDFGGVARRLPVDYLFDLLTPIRERSFSIASCADERSTPPSLQLLVAVVDYRTRLSTARLGLCSNWLARQPVGAALPLSVRRGTFRPPLDDKAAILIGPGTGVAPMRGLIWWRAHRGLLRRENTLLLFGCRGARLDNYFAAEWDALPLTVVRAFSRDQPHKVYVQDKIAEHGALVWRMLVDGGASVVIAGNAKQMPRAVADSLVQVAADHGALTNDASRAWLDHCEKTGVIQYETWS